MSSHAACHVVSASQASPCCAPGMSLEGSQPSSAIASPPTIGRGRSESTSVVRCTGPKCRVSQRAASRIISPAAREDAPPSPPPSQLSPSIPRIQAACLSASCPRSTLSCPCLCPHSSMSPHGSCQVDYFIMSVVHIFGEIEISFRNNQPYIFLKSKLRFEIIKRNFPWSAKNSSWLLAQITCYFRKDSSGLNSQLEC